MLVFKVNKYETKDLLLFPSLILTIINLKEQGKFNETKTDKLCNFYVRDHFN